MPKKQQDSPGSDEELQPQADKGRKALITGTESGIGRAVASPVRRRRVLLRPGRGKHDGADEGARWVQQTGVIRLRVPGDVLDAAH